MCFKLFSIYFFGNKCRCMGSPGAEWCECQSGWGGKGCIKPTQSASLQQQSYLTWALSFSPVSISTNLQLRFVYL